MSESSSPSLGLTPQSRFWSEYTNPCIVKKPPIPIRIRKDQSKLRAQNPSGPIWGRIYQSQSGAESTYPNLGQNLPIPIWGRIYQSQSGAESTYPNLGQNLPIPIWGRIHLSQSGAESTNPNMGAESTNPNMGKNLPIPT